MGCKNTIFFISAEKKIAPLPAPESGGAARRFFRFFPEFLPNIGIILPKKGVSDNLERGFRPHFFNYIFMIIRCL